LLHTISLLIDSRLKEYAPVLAGRGASRGATCFYPLRLRHLPQIQQEEFMPTQILVSNLGEEGGGLKFAVTGGSRFPYSSELLLRE